MRPPVRQIHVTVTLHPVDGSGVTGTAVVIPLDANHTKVTLEVFNGPPGDLPAHIHFDACKLSAIRFGLSNVVDGKSESTISEGIAYLRRGHGAFSIMVHKAEADLPIIACGVIPRG
jgi:hypothetical protein